MTSQKKPGLLDRAKKLGEKLFTKRNVAIAAPIVAGAAALSSKRVREAVGDAAKSAGSAIASTTPARKKASTSSAKRSAAGTAGAAKANAKPAAAKSAATKAGKPKPASKPKAAAKPRAKSAPKAAAPATGGSSGNA